MKSRLSATVAIQSVLAAGLTHVPHARKRVVAFSGGLDSTVLLHALVGVCGAERVRAIYVDHGWDAASAEWGAHCARFAAELKVAFCSLRLQLATDTGESREALAREARYAALFAALEPGEVLLTAHHQRDQAETFLLAALRGAGVQGLAAMPADVQRNSQRLLRPLLSLSVQQLKAYAQDHTLHWLDDPANSELCFDRNFLRHRVLPVLRQRWPAAERTLSRSAALSAEAMALLQDLAVSDIDRNLVGQRLALDSLQSLAPMRQRNALRYVVSRLQLPMPSAAQLEELRQALLESRKDATPRVAWPGVSVRRYRQCAWCFAAHDDPGADTGRPQLYEWNPTAQACLELGGSRGRLEWDESSGVGLRLPRNPGPLQVRFRQGGERLRVATGAPSRTLKNLLQESDTVPWMRGNIPLLYTGDQLLAVGDLWSDAERVPGPGEPSAYLRWTGHAALN